MPLNVPVDAFNTPNVLVPVTPNVPEATMLLPDTPTTYKFPPIPTPPAIVKAPVSVEVELAVDWTIILPGAVKSPS